MDKVQELTEAVRCLRVRLSGRDERFRAANEQTINIYSGGPVATERLKTNCIRSALCELRAHLANIISTSELFKKTSAGAINPTQREYLDHIASSSIALLGIVRSMESRITSDLSYPAGELVRQIHKAYMSSTAKQYRVQS